MSDIKVVVCEGGVPSYLAGTHEDRSGADAQVAEMIGQTGEVDGDTVHVFDVGDDILVVDADGTILSCWNRGAARSPADYDGIDLVDWLRAVDERRARRLIGFRITDLDGICIQGTDADPFGLPADAVLVDGAVLTAKGWAVDRGVLVSPVFAPDADGIEIVDAISIEQAPSPAMR